MSYTRHFSKSIDIPLDIHVNDPRVSSDGNGHVSTSSGSISVNFNGHHHSITIGTHGGSTSRDLGHSETVKVNIHVDTDPFDSSVSVCNDHVNLLTGAVAATETAQVASVRENTRKVAATIVAGFFKNVRSEISTKIMELTQRIDSRLIHLREQSLTLKQKQEQMENDYNRIKSRYIKIFDDLNRELEHRVRSLDDPIFKAVKEVKEESDRMLGSDYVDVAAVIAKENVVLSSQIATAAAKSCAKKTISQALRFIKVQNDSDLAIQRATITSMKAGEHGFYLPVCYYEMRNEDGTLKHGAAMNQAFVPQNTVKRIEELFVSGQSSAHNSREEEEKIEKYFNAFIQQALQSVSNSHDERVAKMISKLYFVK